MTSILEKRKSLHRNLEIKKKENDNLKYQIGQLQALANIGVFTGMIAHEINNLLTPLTNYAMLAKRNPDDTELVEKALNKTLKNSQKATEIMQSILSVSNGENIEKKEIHLKDCVKEIFSCLSRDFSKDNIRVELDIPEDARINVIPAPFQQVLMNLIINARDAMIESGGILKIYVEKNAKFIEINVTDTGKGIPEGIVDKIFDPFFTTKDNDDLNNSGSGLGLAFCKKIIDEHKGSIEVDSSEGKGTNFKIILPN